MKIIGSRTSPFVRMVRTVCAELSLSYDLLETGSFFSMKEEDLRLIQENNPLMKVPVLLDGGQVVLDSRVIVSYLRERYETQSVFENGYESGIEEQNVLSVMYGVLDAGILRFIMSAQGASLEQPYLARSFERMQSGLAYLDAHPSVGRALGVCELSLICALEWFAKRDVIDWSGYGRLVEAHGRWKDRPALIETRIPENV